MDHGPLALVPDVDSENQSVAWRTQQWNTVEICKKNPRDLGRRRPLFSDVFGSWVNPHWVNPH